jgi:hypothetical protein
MATALWVFFDIFCFLLGFLALDRPLTRNERYVIGLLVVAGIGVALFSGYGDYKSSRQIDRLEQRVETLSQGQAFNTGQLNELGQIGMKQLGFLAKQSDASPTASAEKVLKAASDKIVQLQTQVTALKAAEHRHLTPDEKKSIHTLVHDHPDIINGLWIASYPDCFECRAYAWEIAETITAARTDKLATGVLPLPNNLPQLSTDWRGLIIGADPEHLTTEQKALVRLLDLAHLSYSFQRVALRLANGSYAPALLLVAPSPG